METVDFFRKILPATGFYIVVRFVGNKVWHQVCDTIEEAAAYALQFDASGTPTYFACATYREREVDGVKNGKPIKQIRVHRNVQALKSYFLDLDVEPGNAKKYESQGDACEALRKFCNETNLPLPICINSGGGVHVYWSLTHEITVETWRPISETLKAVCAARGFKADPACTSDPARVLRPVGTFNRKTPNDPRRVEDIYDADPLDFGTFSGLVLRAAKAAGVKPPEGTRQVEAKNETINQAFAIARNFPPCSGIKIAERCAQLGRMRDTRGHISEPAWYSGIQLLCHSVEGAALIHEWSKGHPGYSVDETNRKIAQVRGQDIAPTLCKTFEDRSPGGCEGCPSKGKISSPAQLGGLMQAPIGQFTSAVTQAAQRALPDVIVEESRTAVLFRLALAMKATGAEATTLGEVLRTENSRRCQPPFADSEVVAIAKSASSYEDSSLPFTDVGNADRFVMLFGELVRYCHDFKKWLIWDGQRWCFDETGQIIELAKVIPAAIQFEATRAQGQEIGNKLSKHAHATGQQKRIVALLDLAKSKAPVSITSGVLDQRPMLLAVRNGVIDLATGRLRDPLPSDLLTKRAGTVYNPQARCPEWLMFLARIMGNDNDILSFLQRAVGYSLTGQTLEQCLFFLYGSGANGKTTLLNTVEALLGDYATQCQADSLMVKTSTSAANNDIARLRGARLVASSEIEDGSRLAESLVKQLTGQDVVTARFLYGEHFQFRPEFKLWIAGNHKPMIRGDDYAIWRRIMLLPFTVSIPPEEQDHKLSGKLLMELPGILNWALEGCLEWQQSRLKPPSKVVVAVEDYKTEMDVIQTWLDESCQRTVGAKTKASTLYMSYKSWAFVSGHHPMSATKFGLKLTDRGFRKEKSREGIAYLDVAMLAPYPVSTPVPPIYLREGYAGLEASSGNFPSNVS